MSANCRWVSQLKVEYSCAGTVSKVVGKVNSSQNEWDVVTSRHLQRMSWKVLRIAFGVRKSREEGGDGRWQASRCHKQTGARE